MLLQSFPNFELVMSRYRRELRGTLGHDLCGLCVNPSLCIDGALSPALPLQYVCARNAKSMILKLRWKRQWLQFHLSVFKSNASSCRHYLSRGYVNSLKLSTCYLKSCLLCMHFIFCLFGSLSLLQCYITCSCVTVPCTTQRRKNVSFLKRDECAVDLKS